MIIFLPDVSVVLIDNVTEGLAELALEDTMKQISFGNKICVNDTYIIDPDTMPYQQILWYSVPQCLTTSHALIIQYDGFVLDASLWRSEWLNYDYIGAPWPWHPNHRVGNGGFSLRSTRLMKFLAENRGEFPVRYPEDDTLCRVYRPALEVNGFIWAPESVAREFSFEREAPRRTFGFHGIFNFPHVLSKERLEERISLANAYVRSKSEWKELGLE
jgi:Protein of unknown function (DUF5672)